MAVFHYCAKVDRGYVTTGVDGVFELDIEPAADGAWLPLVRKSIADDFTPPEDPARVQIISLTRIGG